MNSLNEELIGRYVVLKQEVMAVGYRKVRDRVVRVEGGFGASAATRGTALMVTFMSDGENTRFEGYEVERFATDDEVAEATP